MKQIALTVTDVSGVQHQTSWTDEPSAQDLRTLHELLRDFGDLDHLKVDTESGDVIYLNPAHIVSVRIQTRSIEGL